MTAAAVSVSRTWLCAMFMYDDYVSVDNAGGGRGVNIWGDSAKMSLEVARECRVMDTKSTAEDRICCNRQCDPKEKGPAFSRAFLLSHKRGICSSPVFDSIKVFS